MRFFYTHFSSLVLMCALTFNGLVAQETSISPYSRFGVGDLESGGFVSNFGMAGTGAGIVDALHINPLNAASLSFLGLGLPPNIPAWGSMVAAGRDSLLVAWWVSTLPGLAILFLVMAINLFGEGLRDILDPRLKLEG